MQTIARANRVFQDKPSGLIVDYVGISRNLQKALAIYNPGGEEIDYPVKSKDELLKELKKAVKKAVVLCRGEGIDLNKINSKKSFQSKKKAEWPRG